jgi:hypothetical protein
MVPCLLFAAQATSFRLELALSQFRSACMNVCRWSSRTGMHTSVDGWMGVSGVISWTLFVAQDDEVHNTARTFTSSRALSN